MWKRFHTPFSIKPPSSIKTIMKKTTSQLLTLFILTTITSSLSSCSNSKKEYKVDPIVLQRPSYSQRPYRTANENTAAAIPTPQATPILVKPKTTHPVVNPSIFHTPNDISLPTENQVSSGL